jgi:hypothetical protein
MNLTGFLILVVEVVKSVKSRHLVQNRHKKFCESDFIAQSFTTEQFRTEARARLFRAALWT